MCVIDNMRNIKEYTCLKPKKSTLDHPRIDSVVEQFFDFVNKHIEGKDERTVAFGFEAYATGKVQGKLTSRAELTGVLKYKIRESDCDLLTFAASTIKKFVVPASSGGGAAKKDEVMRWVASRFGLFTRDDNIADACGVAMCTHAVLIEGMRLGYERHRPPVLE